MIAVVATTTSVSLFGAYGMFWLREEITWSPGSGNQAWQLLGRQGTNRPGLRVCDFRSARGFYVLFGQHRAVYVGLARGSQGIGQRLKTHARDRSDWQRFCWFAFDEVQDDPDRAGWAHVSRRKPLAEVSAEVVLRESEALLITLLGTGGGNQNSMKFQSAAEWHQVITSDLAPRGIARKVAREGFTDRFWRDVLRET